MIIEGQVLNASIEERELTGKDGTKRKSKISHVLLSCTYGKSLEIANIRSYDASWTLPKTGEKWSTPPVKRYENFDGQVADIVV